LPPTEPIFDVRSLSFLENRKLAASYGDGTIKIWDLRKQNYITIQNTSEPIVASSALDWFYLATSNRDILI